MNNRVRVLMTGAGAPGAAGIIKCLLQDPSIDLIIADADGSAVGRYLHPAFFQIPRADEEAFSDNVFSLCKNQGIDLVLPLVTKELFQLSANKHRFTEDGIRVLVSAPEAINISNDKAASYQALREHGVSVPEYYSARTIEEFIHAAFALGHPQEPFCFKPRVANGSRGFRVVSDSINESEQLFYQKPYNTFITYTHALKILSTQPFPPLVVTEYMPGEEYSVDCLADNGNPVMVVPRLRIKMVNGITVQGKFVYDEPIIGYCRQIIQQLGLHGNIGIQIRRSREGKPLLLEINPRVQGTIVAALGAGVNLPVLAVKQELGLPISAQEKEVKWGTAFSRYWNEVYY